MITIILIASVTLQLIAAVLALRLVRTTSSVGWLLIAAAMGLMMSRRGVTLGRLSLGDPVTMDVTTESIALAVSVLMVVGVVLIGSVFERHRRAEVLLRNRERDMREILDSTPDGIVLARDSRWVYANPTAVRLFDLDAEAGANRLLVDSVPEAVDLAGVSLPGGSRREAVELELADHDPPATIEIIPGPTVDYEGAAARLLLVRDLTERKALEGRLLQSQKLEALGQMAGGIAHDFNNLLTVVIASNELARRALGELPKVRAYLDDVAEAAERGATLTAQLLAFTRHGTGGSELIELGALVASMQSLLGVLAGSTIEIDLALAPDAGWIEADRSQIEQVLINLIVNARDAMPDGGAITIKTRSARLDPSMRQIDAPPGPYLVLTVTDQGVGMTAQVQAKIFDPFFTTKAAGKGSGLGLATCYAITRRLHGAIAVTTAVGKGSTFELWLPASQRERTAPPTPEPAAPLPPRTSAVILIVEDEPVVRTVAARFVRREGYEVLEAETAARALEILAARPDIALVFSDLVMPGMAGVDLAQEVQRRYPTVAVLLTSGYAAQLEDRKDVDLVPKPYSPQILLTRIRAALARCETPVASN